MPATQSDIRLNMRYYYTFSASNGLTVTCFRGDGPPKMTGGGGGWEIEDRPRRIGLTLWKGRQPYQMEVPVLVDNLGESIEADVAALNQMQMGYDLVDPPSVRIAGAVPIKNIRWVIDGIDWGDDVIWEQRGSTPARIRQDAVVKLIQFEPEVMVTVRNTPPIPNVYITKEGDTLKTAAQAMYGNATKWKAIAGANPTHRDPNRKLPKGVKIVVPSS